MKNENTITKAKGIFVTVKSPLIGKSFSILNSFNLKMTWIRTNDIFQMSEQQAEKNYLNPKSKFQLGFKFGIKGKTNNIRRFCEKFGLI